MGLISEKKAKIGTSGHEKEDIQHIQQIFTKIMRIQLSNFIITNLKAFDEMDNFLAKYNQICALCIKLPSL